MTATQLTGRRVAVVVESQCIPAELACYPWRTPGLTANTVSPGIIATDAVKRWYADVWQQRGWGTDWSSIEQGVLREVLPNSVGHLDSEDDVATNVSYVASPLSGFINGTNLRVDGGSTGTVN